MFDYQQRRTTEEYRTGWERIWGRNRYIKKEPESKGNPRGTDEKEAHEPSSCVMIAEKLVVIPN
jgi:hypothetical protein